MEFLNEDKRIWGDLTDEEKGLLLLAFHYGKIIEVWDGQIWRHIRSRKKEEWVSPFDYQEDAFRIEPEPVKEVRWCNDYEEEPVYWYPSREEADKGADENRIAVIRREIVDGVVNYYREDV